MWLLPKNLNKVQNIACAPQEVASDEMILDAGPQTVATLRQTFASMKTVVWNGPFGAFELLPFDKATVEAARIVAELSEKGMVTSVAGGGDTVAALNHAGVAERFLAIFQQQAVLSLNGWKVKFYQVFRRFKKHLLTYRIVRKFKIIKH